MTANFPLTTITYISPVPERWTARSWPGLSLGSQRPVNRSDVSFSITVSRSRRISIWAYGSAGRDV